MTLKERFAASLAECPLIAILRGVKPGEVEAIGEALVAAGIRIVEVPLNSPDPLDSIRRLKARLGERAIVGAGTVLEPGQVRQIADAGGEIIVSPSTDPDVIHATVEAGLISAPGYFTPSEAFVAIRAGADAIKLFPAEGASPTVVKAQRAVIPRTVPLLIVGGVAPGTMRPYLEAGADGFGLGSGVYKPGQDAATIGAQAAAYVAALAEARQR